MKPMTDSTLLRTLQQEEQDSASYYDSEIAAAQSEAMDRFHARPYGDEVEGRSKVVTHDIEDTINWIMPALMRAFAPSDELITVDDEALDDGNELLKQAADYISHVWYKDNPGEIVTHDFCFDALLQKVGIIRTYWRDPEPKPVKMFEGVMAEQLAKYQNDPEYEIVEQEEVQKEIDGQPYVCFDLKVRHTPKIGRVGVEAIPCEEFRVSRRAKSIEDADYHAWKRHVFLAPLLKQFPEKAGELAPGNRSLTGDSDVDVATDTRRDSRFPDEPTVTNEASETLDDVGRKKVYQNIEFLRCDYDGDGVVELRRVNRVGDVILENDAVDESEFSAASPMRVAHRLIGRSLADVLLDIQKIRTVLMRRGLDSLSSSTMPRTVVSEDKQANDGSTIDSLMDHGIGDVVKVRGNVNEALMVITTPDVSPSVLTMIEHMDRRSEEASGVNRHAMGIQPQAITETRGGIEMLQAAANVRVEQIARWLAYGLENAMGKVLRLLVAHQDGPRSIKIAGKRMEMDPRRWSDEMTVRVHVGKAGESRDRQIMGLNLLAQKQEAIMMQAGPGNPLVTLQLYRNTLARMAEAMGYRNPGEFFAEIPPDYQPPPPGPDPKMAEVQQKGQLAQAELQAKTQLQAAEFQSKQQLQGAELTNKVELAQMQAQFDAQIASQKAETEREIAGLKAANEMEIARVRIEAESQIARERMQAEMQLATWKAAQEVKIKKHQINATAKAKPNGKRPASNGSVQGMDDVQFGGNIG